MMRFPKTLINRSRLKAILKKNKLKFKDFAEFCGYSAPGLSNSLLAIKADQDIKPVLKYALLLFLLERVKKIDPEALVKDLLIFKDEIEHSASNKITTKDSV